jgi:hypothetical protein
MAKPERAFNPGDDHPRGPHRPRQPGEPADYRRASGPHRRTQALGRWRRHDPHDPRGRPRLTDLQEWELAAFYESLDEPRP